MSHHFLNRLYIGPVLYQVHRKGMPKHMRCNISLYSGLSSIYLDYFQKALDLRRSGSAALDLCSIACGRAEVFFELILSPWDYAAGSLIVQEAGGKVTGLSGEPVSLSHPMGILARGSNVEL